MDIEDKKQHWLAEHFKVTSPGLPNAEKPPHFGVRVQGQTYIDRPVVYGVGINREGLILICKARGHFLLPGGGIEIGETPQGALRREFLEETGWEIGIGQEFCRANQWIFSNRKQKYINKLGHFFWVTPIRKAQETQETDHQEIWVPLGFARQNLRREFHRWAVHHLPHAKRLIPW